MTSQVAFAHEVPPEFRSGSLGSENEQISYHSIKTGEHITIAGLVINNSIEPANVSMTVFTESRAGIPNWQLLQKDPPSRTFAIIAGDTNFPYSITLRALNPGIFHVHLQFTNLDTRESILSVGQTVNVTGSPVSPNALKVSEINGLLGEENPMTLRINSTLEITNFTFDESMKRISFESTPSNVSGGYVIVPISEILEGPYYVTLNGKVASGHATLADRKISGGIQTILLSDMDEILLLIPLSDQSSDQIDITGTQVVPEFAPAAALSIAAAIMISLPVFARYRVK